MEGGQRCDSLTKCLWLWPYFYHLLFRIPLSLYSQRMVKSLRQCFYQIKFQDCTVFCAGGAYCLWLILHLSSLSKAHENLWSASPSQLLQGDFFLKSPFLLVIPNWGERFPVTHARTEPISLTLTGTINVITAFWQSQGTIGRKWHRSFKNQKSIKMYFTSVIFLPKPITPV